MANCGPCFWCGEETGQDGWFVRDEDNNEQDMCNECWEHRANKCAKCGEWFYSKAFPCPNCGCEECEGGRF